MSIVPFDEVSDSATNLWEVSEHAAVGGLLLQCAIESFSDAIRLRFSDASGAERDAPELHLMEEMVGHILGAVVEAQGQPAGRLGTGAPK